MTTLSIALALAGALAVAVAAFLVALPLGLLIAGFEAVLAAYVIRYLEARREVARRAG
jgi:ABC-type phosphate transport system permease subunit